MRIIIIGEIKPVTLDDTLRSLGLICHPSVTHWPCNVTILQNSSGGVLPVDSQCVILAYNRT